MFPDIIAFLSLTIWICLLFFRGFYWRADQCIPDMPAPRTWPEIATVIPARNEEKTIGQAVKSVLECSYPGNICLVVVNDSSSDNTYAIAQAAGASSCSARNRRFALVNAPAKPEGWSGKLWAVHNGILRADEICPDAPYILMTDADIVSAPDTLRRTVSMAEGRNLSLVSLMAHLDTRGRWAGILIPAFIYFFRMLYPFSLVNDRKSRIAGAAGGYMLVRKSALEHTGGIETVRAELVDDCALAKHIKQNSPEKDIWLGLADREATSIRKNETLESIWNMVARTAYAQLRFSPFLLVLTVTCMGLVFMAPPVIFLTFFLHRDISAATAALVTWGIMAYSYIPTLGLYGRKAYASLFLPFPAMLFTLMTISSASRYRRGAGGQWKGRSYPAPGRKQSGP